MEKPSTKPKNPNFSSGPCSKRPGWSFDVLKNAPIGRSHRAKECKDKLNEVIINTARGNIVDENDLNAALNENLITGAALDVYSKEPAKENILFNNPKVILTPHVAASTAEASIIVAEMVANQISDFLLKGDKVNTV